MNLGKINNLMLNTCKLRLVAKSKLQFAYKESGLDIFIEKINKKISYLLGNNSNKPGNKTTSNVAFVVIIILVLLLLWESTGFYYLNDKQSGVVLTNGKITKIINGMKVGFLWPYPFSDIEIVDTGVTDFIKVSKSDTEDYYSTLSKDLQKVNISAKFSYQVINPKLLYLNVLQKNDSLDDVVKFIVWQKLHTYIANNTQIELSSKNLTVMSTDIKTNINQSLANWGLNLVKLQIDNINYSSNENSNISYAKNLKAIKVGDVSIPSVAAQIINEANRYSNDKISETLLNIDKFNQLLPQYRKNPDGIAMQMYYDMLEKVPMKKDNDYVLLNTKLSDLLLKTPESNGAINKSNDDDRSYSRNVDRDRDLGGR